MLAVMTIAWVHGCIGLYFWLRMRAFYKRAAPFLLAAAVLIPTLVDAGLLSERTHGDRQRQQGMARGERSRERQIGTRAEAQTLERITDYFLFGYFGLIGIALLARGARAINERRRGMINLSYGNGRTVRVPKGLSVLEASLRNNVPHASVCGGRARCSTCRIRIIGDYSDAAGALAARGVRARPGRRAGSVDPPRLPAAADVRSVVLPALPAAHHVGRLAMTSNPTRIGQERYLVSLFVDMRGSTKLAEKRLPFDTVFIVNRFLGAVSQAVLEMRRPAEPVRRRRHAGAVRACRRSGSRPAARRCARRR